MAKLQFLLQICLLTCLLQLTYGEEMSPNSTLWPDLSCHEGYIKVGQMEDENGEERLLFMGTRCAIEMKSQWLGDKYADCLKRCILEGLGILKWRVFEFRSEAEIANNLNRNLFTYTLQTGENIAKRILESDCQPMLTALANSEKKPTCDDQNEFFDCLENAMQCK